MGSPRSRGYVIAARMRTPPLGSVRMRDAVCTADAISTNSAVYELATNLEDVTNEFADEFYFSYLTSKSSSRFA